VPNKIHFGPAGKTIRNREIKPDPLLKYPELKTDPVFIIGKGLSRKGFDLKRLIGKGTIIGCNALYRDFKPDILTVVNTSMMIELQEYAKENFCLTHKPLPLGLDYIKEWQGGHINSSGCLAIRLTVLIIKPSKCYMLGMDGCEGNIYHDSRNYPEEMRRNLERMFVFNIAAVKSSKETKFINVNIRDEWPKDAVEFMNYTEFETIMES